MLHPAAVKPPAPVSLVFALVLLFASAVLCANTAGTGDIFDFGYRGVEVIVGPVFRNDEVDSDYRKPGPRPFLPIYYQVVVSQNVIRQGRKIGHVLFSKELKLDELDYDTVRLRPRDGLVRFDQKGHRLDFFLHTEPGRLSFSHVLDESKLLLEQNTDLAEADSAYRVWKSAAGTTVHARYISRSGDVIKLEKPDKTPLQVTLNDFAESDRQLLRRLSGETAATSSEDRAKLVATLQKLGERASNGDLGAIDEIASIADELYQDMRPDDGPRIVNNYALLQEPFRVIGGSVSHNAGAFEALVHARTNMYLDGFALTWGMARAAAEGNKRALDYLLDPARNKIPRATAAEALVPAAHAQIPDAVEFMLKLIEDETNKGIMKPAAKGLVPAARKGDERAQAALKKYRDRFGPDLSIGVE